MNVSLRKSGKRMGIEDGGRKGKKNPKGSYKTVSDLMNVI